MDGLQRNWMSAIRRKAFGSWRRWSALALLALGGPWCLAGQTGSKSSPAAEPAHATSGTAHRAHRHGVRPSKARAETKAATAVPAAPAPPRMPQWPVNEKPTPAHVMWDSHGLQIDASNSSLVQIFGDVTTATGAKVVGLQHDERVFGQYGPGPARDVLAQLLQGSGYNVMMIGGEGLAAPNEILLTSRSASGGGSSAMTPSNSAEAPSDADQDEAQPATTQLQQENPPAPPRTPQEILDQMRARQLQMIQQRPQAPPNP